MFKGQTRDERNKYRTAAEDSHNNSCNKYKPEYNIVENQLSKEINMDKYSKRGELFPVNNQGHDLDATVKKSDKNSYDSL